MQRQLKTLTLLLCLCLCTTTLYADTAWFFAGDFSLRPVDIEKLLGAPAKTCPDESGGNLLEYHVTIADTPAVLQYIFNPAQEMTEIYIRFTMREMTADKFRQLLDTLTAQVGDPLDPFKTTSHTGEETGAYNFRYFNQRWLNDRLYADLVAISPIAGLPVYELEGNGGYALDMSFKPTAYCDVSGFDSF